MVTYLTSVNVGVTGTAPTITLPAAIPANSVAYLLVHASSGDSVLSGFTGWTVLDGPKQAGNSVAMSWLLSRAVGATDSSTVHNGTLTTAGSPRWATECVVVTGGSQSTLTYGVDSTTDTTLSIPGYTPTVTNADVLVMAGLTTVTGQGHMTVTAQPTGFTGMVDSGSSYGSSVELNTYAARKTLAGQSGVAQAATTATTDKTARGNVWVITFAPVASSTVPTPVGGTVLATPSASSGNIAYPAGIQAGDVGVLIGSYNGGAVTPAAPSGWAGQGSAHQYSSTMFVQAFTRTMTGTETGNLALSWGTTLTKTSWAMTVWRGARLAAIAYNDAATDAATVVAVPAVATPSGTAVFSTAWFERSSTPDTSVTIPAGTTLVDSAYGTGNGAASVALARNATANTSGSVGSGSWTRPTANPAGTVAATIAFYGSAAPPSTTDVWFVMQANRSLKAQTVTYA